MIEQCAPICVRLRSKTLLKQNSMGEDSCLVASGVYRLPGQLWYRRQLKRAMAVAFQPFLFVVFAVLVTSRCVRCVLSVEVKFAWAGRSGQEGLGSHSSARFKYCPSSVRYRYRRLSHPI
jgi:hypothetical protein